MLLEFPASAGNPAPPTGQVLTYNTTNDRGWNDPPSYVFSPTNINRKRIDPRKRVGHDLTSGVVHTQQQPPNHAQPPGGSYANGIQTNLPKTQTFAASTGQPGYINGCIPPPIPNASNTTNPPPPSNAPMLPPPSNPSMAHANSNPDIHNLVNDAAPPIHHANSMPYNLDSYGQPTQQHQPTLHDNTQLPPRLSSLPPAVPAQPSRPPNAPLQNLSLNCSRPAEAAGKVSPNRALTPTSDKAGQGGRKLVAPTTCIDNSNSIFGNSIFSQLSTPTMLQSSHLANKTDSAAQAQTNVAASNTGFRSISPVTQPSGSCQLQTTPSLFSAIANPKLSIYSNNAPSSLPPMPVAGTTEQANLQHVRANSLTGIQAPPRVSPTNTVAAAPPTNGFYVANKVQTGSKHSPKSLSPRNSGTSSPVPMSDKLIQENDSELLNETVDRLLVCRDKCAYVTTNKIIEEMNKKIQAFKLAWTTGKLSANVKLQMSNLSIALDKREFAQADSIHKSLIVGHSSEVMAWMVGVKKLISSYQKVVEENNKY